MKIHNKHTYQHYISNFSNPSITYISTSLHTRNKKNTIQEILHIVKEKHKIKINPNNYLESNFPYDPGGTMIY